MWIFDFGLEKHWRNGPQFIDLDKAKRERVKNTPREKGEKFLIRCWFKCRGASTSTGLGTTAEPRRGQVPATKSLWVTFEARCRNVNEASLLYIDLSGQWNSQSRSKRCVLGRLERDEKRNRAGEGKGREMIRGSRLLPLPILPHALAIFRLRLFVYR